MLSNITLGGTILQLTNSYMNRVDGGLDGVYTKMLMKICMYDVLTTIYRHHTNLLTCEYTNAHVIACATIHYYHYL